MEKTGTKKKILKIEKKRNNFSQNEKCLFFYFSQNLLFFSLYIPACMHVNRQITKTKFNLKIILDNFINFEDILKIDFDLRQIFVLIRLHSLKPYEEVRIIATEFLYR